jgi:hypothetical protein
MLVAIGHIRYNMMGILEKIPICGRGWEKKGITNHVRKKTHKKKQKKFKCFNIPPFSVCLNVHCDRDTMLRQH